ncbi:MAG TPA: ribonuclease Z [Deltaproteobacteria bacterium]|nr:ribonuclease Z [Deltaproteobacteria bacterium]
MSERKLVVLGTASQVPGRARNHNGYLLRFDEEGLLFDPGEGTQRQMIFSRVSVSQVTRIFITHFHGDHCLGLAGLIQRLSLDQVEHVIDVYYPSSGQIFYEHLRDSCLYHGTAVLREHPITTSGIIDSCEKFTIEAVELDHPVETYGYRISEHSTVTLNPEQLNDLGITGPDVGRIKREGRLSKGGKTIHLHEVSTPLKGQVFSHIMDTGVCEGAHRLAADADLCVMEATFLSDREETAREYGHLTAAQTGSIAREAGVKKLVLTHFSQRYLSLELFAQEAGAFHDDIVIAQDGDVVFMPKRTRRHH